MAQEAPRFLSRSDGATIAYHASPTRGEPKLPGLIYLGGFMSDMTGGKAMHLEAAARARGQAFLRFDYLGHGASSGRFADGTIGRWAEDAIAVIDELSEGPQVLVGSSMGGWLMLLAALARPRRIAGLVGIAAAPDFTEELIWAKATPEMKAKLEKEGYYEEPSQYGEAPYVITRALVEEGRQHLLLQDMIPLTCPVRLIHGQKDPDVPWQTALRIAECLAGTDVEVILVKDGEHRLSEPSDLVRLDAVVGRLSDQLANG